MIVLVNPQLGQNIGAAARAMLNFGLEQLRLVAPRDGWPNPDAISMASGAGRILDNTEIYPDVASAISDVHHAYSTTARHRDLPKRILNPETAMSEARRRCRHGEKVAILFGPERAGLTNRDHVLASSVISVPANPAFSSLNLAQCVLLIGYEWFKSISVDPIQEARLSPEFAPTIQMRESLAKQYEAELEGVGYFWPEEKAGGMRLNLRNLFMRLDLTEADVRTLHGIKRALMRGSRRRRDRHYRENRE